jgi:hypothetical protein
MTPRVAAPDVAPPSASVAKSKVYVTQVYLSYHLIYTVHQRHMHYKVHSIKVNVHALINIKREIHTHGSI